MKYNDITPNLSSDQETINGITYKVTYDSKGTIMPACRALSKNADECWRSTDSACPHYWQIFYSTPIFLQKLSFRPTNDNIAQLVKKYELHCSNDGVNYTNVASGTCINDGGNIAFSEHTINTITLSDPVKCHYVKLVIVNTYDTRGYKWAGISSVRLTGKEVISCELYKDSIGAVYGMSNSAFTKFTDNWSALTDTEKVALFETTNYEVPTVVDLATIGQFKVLSYSEVSDQATCTATAVPKDHMVFPKGLISLESFEGIDKAAITSNTSGNGAAKLLVTTDLSTYQTYDTATQTWLTVDHTNLSDVAVNSIQASELQNIPRFAWDTLNAGKTGIGFAYLLVIEDTTDVCAIDKLDLQVDMKGSWIGYNKLDRKNKGM